MVTSKKPVQSIADGYRKNEIQTNRVVGFYLASFALMYAVNCFLAQFDAEEYFYRFELYISVCSIAVITVVLIVARIFRYSPWIKYMMLACVTIMTSGLFFAFSFKAIYCILIPIFISARYFNKRLISIVAIITGLMFIAVSVLSIELDRVSPIINIIHEFVSKNIWKNRLDTVIFCIIPCLLTMLFLSLFAVNLTKSARQLLSEKIAGNRKIAAVDAELETAAQIQRSVLPGQNYETGNGNFSIYAYESPAKEVCGDFYDYFMVSDTVLAVLVADVSDKGVPAAMFMMSAKKLIQCALYSCHSIDDAISLANYLICSDNECGMFLTLWMGLIDTESGVGKYVNAGHPYPMLKHADGSIDRIENEPNLFIGNFPEKNPTVHNFKMEKGDVLFIYTDGLTDAENADGERFGDNRAVLALERSGNTAEAVTLGVIAETGNFSGEHLQYDDITVLALQCNSTDSPTVSDITVESDISGTAKITELVQDMLTSSGCPDDNRRNIGVAVDEICANISSYAYGDGKGEMSLHATLGKSFIELEFSDRGKPFNPIEYESRRTSAEQIGGLGITFVKNLSDEVSYRYSDGRNILKTLFIWNL